MHCLRNAILPDDYEWTCFSCGFNVMKQNNQLTISPGNKLNLFDGIKCSEKKMFVNCTDKSRICEGDDNEN